ncbi:MAG: hypothetical protein JST42_14795 [Bacteroidetes bacterium]|nr:hypothetical protein [Bacteroidota bacterium]
MQPIIQHLFQASSLEEVSRQRLESFVAEYPSFGIGHYLLSRKLLAEGADSYLPETQRTNLYFTNPFWLQWLLDNPEERADGDVVRTSSLVRRVEDRTEPGPVKDTMDAAVEEAFIPGYAPELASETAPVTEEPEPAIESASVIGEPDAAPATGEPDAAPATEEPDAAPITEEQEPATSVSIAGSAAANPSESHDQPESMVALAEKLSAPSEQTAAELLLQSIEEAKGLRESLQKINEDFHTDRPLAPAPVEAFLPAEHPEVAQPHSIEEPIKDEEAPFVLEEEGLAEGPVASVAEDPTANVVEDPAANFAPEVALAREPAVTAEPSPAPPTGEPEPAKPTEQAYIFEPYHTIDYFASQGIKLHLEENPTDQLGKQLKSFTEWLKTMRRLPQKEREVVPDQVAEQTIQTIAAHSVVGREVVTETMAEVLAKQGMPERARALYEKLSFLNPDKKAYFAAKIEQLNSH